jgi:subtilisin family serine protease
MVPGIMNRKERCRERLMLAAFAASFFIWLTASAGVQSDPPAYRADRILIKPKAGINRAALDNFHRTRKAGLLRTFEGIGRLQVLSVPAGETADGLIAKYRQSGLVEFAEPDYLVYADATTPNDPKFVDGTLWGLNNYGQNGGTAHADIDATNAWDVLTSASNIVVAVLDSGIRATHEDLALNMWVNPTDGGNGYNAFTGTNNPSDDSTSHGTMVAGVLGAVGNNGKGVCGVAWRVQMMVCKCLNNSAGSDSTVIACIDYAITNGARIINASFDSPTPSLALSNAIVAARDAGIVWVASAGNGTSSGRNLDTSPGYPTCYLIDNIVSVAYTTRTDALGGFSNYGATNVDLAAPGDQIYTTFAASDSYYWPPSGLGINVAGTSFSAPCVSGACALLMAQYPADNYREIIARLLSSTDPLPSLAGKCRTGGRLNLYKALRTIRVATIPPTNSGPFQLRVSGGLNRTCVVEATTNLTGWAPVFTNSTSTNGIFDFADDQITNLPQRFFRATASP